MVILPLFCRMHDRAKAKYTNDEAVENKCLKKLFEFVFEFIDNYNKLIGFINSNHDYYDSTIVFIKTF